MTGARLDREAVEAVRRRWGVPALGVALVHADGGFEPLVVGDRRRDGSGAGAVQPDGAAQPDDPWHIGSCAKSMTAAAYALLVEHGAAAWGATLNELFDDLAPHVDPTWSTVTIDELLRHRAGFPANLDEPAMRAALTDSRSLDLQRTEAVARVLAAPPRGQGRFRYSNLGYIAAGAAIERIVGLPFERTVAEVLLEPLGITSYGFGPPVGLWGHRGRFTLAGTGLGRGQSLDPNDPASDNPAVLGPAGRLHLTMADWAKFLRLFLVREGAPALLSTDSVDRLLSADVHAGAPQGMGWAPAHALEGASFGQQGSNTAWVTTALLDHDRARAAMVLVNDGRTAMLRRTAIYAADLLRGGSEGS